jgi:hypothetical protein
VTAVDAVASEADAAIEAARASVESADVDIARASRFESVSRLGIGIAVIIVWAAVVLSIAIWTIADSDEFVCSRPGDAASADYQGECESGFDATKDSLQNLLTVGVLPLVTLVLGFYFGKQSAEQAEEA